MNRAAHNQSPNPLGSITIHEVTAEAGVSTAMMWKHTLNRRKKNLEVQVAVPRRVGAAALGFAGMLALCFAPWFCPADGKTRERELIRDPDFRRGFTLIEPEPGKRVPYGIIRGPETNVAPVWNLDQWSSRHPLAIAGPNLLADGSLVYSNIAKAVRLGSAGSDRGDLELAVRASAEYGSRARRSGEPWVHLLVEQNLANPPSIAELSAARLHVEAKLLSSEKRSTPDYSLSLHAAQFQIFFSVQNLNRQSPGYGHYLWFGIPIYDDRQPIAPAHQAQDTGGTSMFIYTPAGDVFCSESAHERKWITIDRDLLPLMREGLEDAWNHNFLKESQVFEDYRIAGMNLGWEVPGIFNVDLQIRRLSLKIVYRNNE
jgi:hypothetical protein